jgi:hypothetical protein
MGVDGRSQAKGWRRFVVGLTATPLVRLICAAFDAPTSGRHVRMI